MVYVPYQPPHFGYEYYKSAQESQPLIRPLGEVTGSKMVTDNPQAVAYSGDEGSGLIDPILAAFRRRQRRRRQEDADQRDPEKKDIVAARLRGGMVQYMVSMGYPREVAIREANRAIAQILRDEQGSSDAPSRQVYLNQTPMMMMTQLMQQTANDDPLITAAEIATSPKALVDIRV